MQETGTAVFQSVKPHLPEQENLKCPRCESTNTKFCYYNNYNLSQPRHFCKNCRRYWTKGGTLRNVPVGGGSRRNSKRANSKRAASASSSTSTTPLSSDTSIAPEMGLKTDPAGFLGSTVEHDRRLLEFGGSFSALLASNGNFNGLFGDLGSDGSAFPKVHFGQYPANGNGNTNSSSSGDPSLELGDSSCWGGANGWPDLAIYTPGSHFSDNHV